MRATKGTKQPETDHYQFRATEEDWTQPDRRWQHTDRTSLRRAGSGTGSQITSGS
ncbi:MAG: hypothetical protein K6E86_00030 [Bacteroidales bacterium]|nr:hypothetical protein [Bacteroidales bacterium]